MTRVLDKYNAVKVFSGTKARDRENLGADLSKWIAQQRPRIVDTVVLQSSDSEFHCLSIIVFYNHS